jgi:hypothetical protein
MVRGEKQMEKHVTAVGVIRIGWGIVGILAAILILTLLVGVGVFLGEQLGALLATIGSGIAVLALVLSVPDIVGGIGVLRRKSWARYMVLVLAVLDLINIPVGTAVGIYSIWVLVQDETAQLFVSESSQ